MCSNAELAAFLQHFHRLPTADQRFLSRLLEFKETYNECWLIERHGHRSPARFRRDQMDNQALVA